MLCDSLLCRDGIVVIKFTKSRKMLRHVFLIYCYARCAGADASDNCSAVPTPTGQPVYRPVNRETMSWSVSGAWWAYTFGRLSTLGAQAVGQDQLVAGPYPDNCPFVACLSWEKDGAPNAKYYAIQMLASAFGSDNRTIHPVHNPTVQRRRLFVGAYTRAGVRWLLLITKDATTIHVGLKGTGVVIGDVATVIGGDLPLKGFNKPVQWGKKIDFVYLIATMPGRA